MKIELRYSKQWNARHFHGRPTMEQIGGLNPYDVKKAEQDVFPEDKLLFLCPQCPERVPDYEPSLPLSYVTLERHTIKTGPYKIHCWFGICEKCGQILIAAPIGDWEKILVSFY